MLWRVSRRPDPAGWAEVLNEPQQRASVHMLDDARTVLSCMVR